MKKLIAMLVDWGSPGLFLAALLDGAGLPVPGGVDVLIIFLAGQMRDSPILLAIVAVLGSTLGNLLLFFLARRGGEIFLTKRSGSRGSTRFRRWFDHYGLITVFIAALVPLPVMPMKIFVICAGALRSSVISFIGVFVCARIVRYLGLAYLGSAMGSNALVYLRSHVWHLTTFATALFLLLWLLIRIAERRTSPNSPV